MPHRIDPEIAAARKAQAAAATPFDITKGPIAEARMLANAAAMFFNDGTPEVARVETFDIPGPAGPMRARSFAPSDASPGAVLYLHGGGWCMCNVDTHDALMRRLALESGLEVIGVDFRLAPEHPFPAPLDDALAAFRCLRARYDRIGIAGDSAGANLALGVALSERDAGPCASALFYGCFAPIFDTPSHAANGDGRYGLTTARMAWYWQQFLGGSDDPRATPLHGDFAGLGPHFLGLADLDCIADDTRMLAERMRAAGVDATLVEWPGAVHGFMQMGRHVALARAAIAQAGAFLKEHV